MLRVTFSLNSIFVRLKVYLLIISFTEVV
jgi:hypothetical protein